jgi:ubiquinone/menaquinone biosynthesis C-methylase UbiE
VNRPSKLRTTASRLLGSGTPKASPRIHKGRLFPGEATIPRPDPGLRHYDVSSELFNQIALITLGRLNMAGLRPDHDVLDIGCGIGRMARYLCDYLGTNGRYRGFDVMSEPIEWCQANITPRFPNFTFQFSPLFNAKYNPDRELPSAAGFSFPYPDDSFDFVFAQSVFSHLQPDESANYLKEIARVLKRGAVSYCTWILFKDGSSDYPHPNVAKMRRDPSGTFALLDPDEPAKAVAYDESFVLDAYRKSGLEVGSRVYPGFLTQDAVVATK